MSALWLMPLYSGLAAHNWLLQAAVILMVAGVWLFLAGAIERRAAWRLQSDLPVNR